MTDTVRITTGGMPQRFPFNLPGQPTVTTTTVNTNSAPIPKDGTFATYEGFLQGTSGAQGATMTFQVTNDPHTAGMDDASVNPVQRNNFSINTTNTSTTITTVNSEPLFRPDMDGDEVYAVGVPVGTTMTYVSATSATLSAAATATSGTKGVQARFQALHWVLLGTLTLSGTKHAEDGFATASNWKFSRVVVSAISGTGCVATAIQGT